MDFDSVKTIREWATPSVIHEATSFHVVATFYYRSVKGFSTNLASVTTCLKKGVQMH